MYIFIISSFFCSASLSLTGWVRTTIVVSKCQSQDHSAERSDLDFGTYLLASIFSHRVRPGFSHVRPCFGFAVLLTSVDTLLPWYFSIVRTLAFHLLLQFQKVRTFWKKFFLPLQFNPRKKVKGVRWNIFSAPYILWAELFRRQLTDFFLWDAMKSALFCFVSNTFDGRLRDST